MTKIDIACIVDDDPIFVYGTKRLIEISGSCNNVLIFKNGKTALDHLTAVIKSGQNIPQLILLDINMPVMDGWEFLDEFTKIKPPKKIVIYVVSSSINPADIKRAEGFSDVSNYVIKPVTLKEVENLLTQAKDLLDSEE